MSFYHRHRPQQFKQLIGQDHIRAILQAALRQDRVSHSYLFAGTRGTGKTTTARLLAKAINCGQPVQDEVGFEPCNSCPICLSVTDGHCLDVIEIDAASNRGIEEIRQLQDQSRFRPQIGRKKVVIIDEVHMLTKEAFNALLKTLEEPPDHLVFILATTEAHKIPATILSRCQRFDFSTPSQETIQEYLARMSEAEKITAEAEALRLVAELAHGSFRDSASLLEQLATHDNAVTMTIVQELFAVPPAGLLNRYLDALSEAQGADTNLQEDLHTYFKRGGHALAFIEAAFRQLASRVQDGSLGNQAATVLASLVRIKYQMKECPIPELPILVALGSRPSDSRPVVAQSVVESSIAETRKVSADKSQPKPAVKEEVSDKKDEVVRTEELASATAESSPEMVTITVAEQIPPAPATDTNLDAVWQQTIQKLANQNQSSLVAILRTAQPAGWQAPVFQIGVQFKFHADQLARQRNRAILESMLSELLGQPVRIEMEVRSIADLTAVVQEVDI